MRMSPSNPLSRSLRIVVIIKLFMDVITLVTDAQCQRKYRYFSSCEPAEYDRAMEKCTQMNGSLFSWKTLILAEGLPVLNKAIDEHQVIWLDKDSYIPCQDKNQSTTLSPSAGESGTTELDSASYNESNKGMSSGLRNGVCNVTLQIGKKGNNTIESRPCSDKIHYVCSVVLDPGSGISSNDSYIPCQDKNQGTTLSTSAGESGTSDLDSATDKENNKGMSSVSVIAIAVCVAVPVGLGVVAVIVYCAIKRNKTPKRYAVRVESAIYHRNNPKPDREVNDTTTEETAQVTTEGFVIGAELKKSTDNEEYDVLWRTSKNGVKAKDEGPKGVYGHLVRNMSKKSSGEENEYDTTTLPDYDTRPVDNTYARTYFRI